MGLLIIRDIGAIRIGDVVDLPGELQVSIVAKAPCLSESGVQVEDAFAAEVVALAVLAGIREPDGSTGAEALVDGARVVKELRGTVLVKVKARLDLSGDYAVAVLLPICGPSRIEDRERQTAGGAQDTGELPAADEDVDKAVGGAEGLRASTEGKLVDSVDCDQGRRIEVRHAAIEARVP